MEEVKLDLIFETEKKNGADAKRRKRPLAGFSTHQLEAELRYRKKNKLRF